MNGYYPIDQSGPGDNMMGVMNQDEMSPSMMGGHSLDDIVNQNSKAMRRQSVPIHYSSGRQPDLEGDMRRVSMLEFSGAAPGQLDQFQFDPATAAPNMENMMSVGDAFARRSNSYQRRRPSAGDLSLDTRLHNSQASFANMPAPGSYASPLAPTTGMDMSMTSPYAPSALPMSMDMTDPSLSMMNTSDGTPMNMFSQPQFASPMMGSPIAQDFADSMHPLPDPGGSAGPGSMDLNVGSEPQSMTPDLRRDSQEHSAPHSAHSSRPQNGNGHNPMPQAPEPNAARNGTYGPERQIPAAVTPIGQQLPWATPPGGFPSTMQNRPHMETQFKNVYSSTGFDMLGVLMRVATRPKPEINIGSVDLSCAFVVCDADKDDFPIVYCSENFERLTGYTRHMILGRNCRFLQSPDGKVEAGAKRKYVDDDSVLYLKNMINTRKEAQISLINYRRGGQPFMNLLTMIPITWDDSEVVKFFVGFQVDLVEQPNSVTNKNPDGTYSINYQRAVGMPRYVFNTPEQAAQGMEMGQTIPRDDVSALLETLVNGENEASKRLWDKALLENTDDVIHVLSLKGLFLYLSPSAARVLEYEASELVGTALSSVCHPSDIVPVTRELKDTSAGSAVNVVFRIRRKHSGYMWFEGHGSLHTEQGKGRKCIILVGRERPVYALSKSDIDSNGGIGDNELWTKMSTSGMFLFVSSNVRSLLDRQPDDLVGTSIQALMRQESKQEFHRILEMARTGKKASVKHEMMNKRGQVLQAFTTIYPGDAVEGQKPTFVIAQTRLLKFSRGSANANSRPNIYPKHERDSGSSIGTTVGSTPTHTANTPSTQTPGSLAHGLPLNQYITTDGSAMTYAGSSGLKLGHQDASLASEDNVFEELKTTRSTSWQYELRQMEKRNRLLAEEVQSLLAAKKKRKRRKGAGQLQKDCANCHTRVTPEWRRGPSGNRDLCNSCGLRWAKQNGRVSPRTTSQHSVHSAGSDKASKTSASPLAHSQTINNDNNTGTAEQASSTPDMNPAKVPKTDAAASQGLGPGAVGASIPPKIDEVTEEPD